MDSCPTKRLEFVSDLKELPAVLQSVLQDIPANGFDEDAVFAIRLALDEALSNAIRHGNSGDSQKRVVVEYGMKDDAFQVSVTDEGHGFIPDKVPDPTLAENLERPCGRGVMLMKAYMSHVCFNERGNRVTLIKNRDCTLPVRTKR